MGANNNSDRRFLYGLELFNQREFFACHEVLESLWLKEPEPERQLTQGLIQIAVAYYHSLKGNQRGALKLMRRGRERLKLFLPESRGLLLSEFLSAVEQDLSAIAAGAYAQDLLIPRIKMFSPDRQSIFS